MARHWRTAVRPQSRPTGHLDQRPLPEREHAPRLRRRRRPSLIDLAGGRPGRRARAAYSGAGANPKVGAWGGAAT